MMSRLGVVLSCGLFLAVASCGEKGEGADEAKKKVKVDCDQMCAKTFKECVAEVMIGSGQLSNKQLEMVKKAGALKKMKDKGFEACLKDCQKKKGFGSDAASINECLDKKDCKEYADCVKQHLK